MEQKENPPMAVGGLNWDCHVSRTQPAHFTRKRYKCPIHHGKNRSVAVGVIDGRAWAKCWSHGCASADILAALNLTNSRSIPWTPAPPRLRPAFSVKPLTPVSHTQALDYLQGIGTPEGAGIAYQRDDGQRGRHWRNPDKRRNPGVKGEGWQLRRFDPADPSAALVIALAEGEKDAAIMASSGVIAFTAPRGAQSLPLADFTELVALAKETGLPVVLAGDNDKVGRDAMRRVRAILKMDHHLDASYLFGPEKGSVADFPTEDLKALIRVKLSDRTPSWQKPGRNRAEYLDFKCPNPRKRLKKAGDVAGIYGTVPCGNTATCRKCLAWENFLHVERCWKGNPAQMVQVSGFGEDGSTIPQTTWLAKVYRSHFEERLRRNADVNARPDLTTGKRQHFMTALSLGLDYRASLAVFFAHPLPDKQIAKERRRAASAGLSFTVTNVVTRDDIENAAPPSLTIHMDGEGSTTTTHCWTASHWPTWWQPDTTYAFSDGVDLEDGQEVPADSISGKDWRREYGQEWDHTKTLKDNLIQREDHAFFNAQLWMTPCHGLNLETLQAIADGENIPALIAEIGDYQGPTALLRDTAEWLVGRGEWRKAYRPVLIAAGWRG